MSSRKYSLKLDQNLQEYLEYNSKSIQLTRTRKNSIGLTKPYLQQINSNINITLDQKLTQKLIFIKKLQKLQKQAIKCFYDQKSQQCFQILSKSYKILQDKNINSQGILGDQIKYWEHMIYIRYLQCQFKYKIKLYQQSRQYYTQVLKIINKLSKYLHPYHRPQKDKIKQYISSLEALHCCLLYQQGKYSDAVKEIQELQWKVEEGMYRISDKLVKQVYMCKIQALVEMGQYQLGIKFIEKYLGKYQLQTLKQKWKINTILAQSYKKTGQIQKSQQVMQHLIQNMRKQDSIYDTLNKHKNQQKYNEYKLYLSKCYMSYIEIFWQQPIKAIFLAKKWGTECQGCDQVKIKLFQLYYRIGDYEEALSEFSQISENYKKSSEDWEVLGQIKYFYGELQTARYLFMKALQLVKNQQRKLLIQIRLLQFISEVSVHKQSIKTIQKRIKQHRSKPWIHKTIQRYGEYLKAIGQQYRIQKINKIITLTNENQNIINNGGNNGNGGNDMGNCGNYNNISFKKDEEEDNWKCKKFINFGIAKIL